jgi:hypothetical protein
MPRTQRDYTEPAGQKTILWLILYDDNFKPFRLMLHVFKSYPKGSPLRWYI